MYKASQIEVNAFYLWLSGKFKAGNQRANLLPVYVCCPAERDNLLREFLASFHAEHRYHPLKLALSSH